MELKTIADFKRISEFNKSKDVISLDLYNRLLKKAEKLHEENLWLYEKMNIISETIEEVRENVNEFQ